MEHQHADTLGEAGAEEIWAGGFSGGVNTAGSLDIPRTHLDIPKLLVFAATRHPNPGAASKGN